MQARKDRLRGIDLETAIVSTTQIESSRQIDGFGLPGRYNGARQRNDEMVNRRIGATSTASMQTHILERLHLNATSRLLASPVCAAKCTHQTSARPAVALFAQARAATVARDNTFECTTASAVRHRRRSTAQQCNGQTDAFFALMIQHGNRECCRFNSRSGIRRDVVWQWNSFAT